MATNSCVARFTAGQSPYISGIDAKGQFSIEQASLLKLKEGDYWFPNCFTSKVHRFHLKI